MGLGDYVLGVVLLAVGVGAPAWAAWRLVQARLAWMAPEARAVAWALLLTAALALTTGLPLVLGILERWSVAVAAVALAGLSLLVRPAAPAPREGARGTPSAVAAWAVGGLLVGMALVYVMAFERTAAPFSIVDTDSTSFIIPTLQSWIVGGSLWAPHDYVAGWPFGAYPNTGGLVQLAVVVPWRAEFALRAVNPAFLVVSGLSVYAIAAELGARRAVALGAAAVAVMLPASAVTALAHAQTDGIAAAGVASGALFLLRHARTGRGVELALAALGFGIAFGTKWYGPPEVAAVLAVWLGAGLLARRRAGARPVLRDGVLVGAGAAIVGGVWLVRNLAEFGSPLFPSGALLFDGPERTDADTIDFALLDYADAPGVLADVALPQLVDGFALAGGAFLLAALVAGVLAARARDARVAALAVSAFAVLAVYVAMPYSALGTEGEPVLVIAAVRYGVPGFLLAAGCAAWLVSRAGPRLRAAAGVLAVAALLDAFRHYDALAIGVDVAPRAFALAAVALVVAAAAMWLLRDRRRLWLPAAVVVGAGAAAAGRSVQQEQMPERFEVEPAFAFVADRAPEDHTIGLAGLQTGRKAFVVAAFGPRIGNEVRFVGPRVDHLQERDREPRAFRRRLAASDVDYLVVGADREGPAPELAWAQDAGWRAVARGPRLTVLAPPQS